MSSQFQFLEVARWSTEQPVRSRAPQPDAEDAALAAAFACALPINPGLDPSFAAALRHLLLHPGSMVRSRVVAQLAAAYGMSREPAMNMAIALECFHTASLVFDDLPCMDDASMRRGIECVHVRYGEAGAILAALGLINRAYALMWRTLADCNRSVQQAALDYLEQRLGVEGLLNGQALDLNYGTHVRDHKATERIAVGKTVSLIRLSLVMPALSAGAPRRHVQLLERLSYFWGLAYQMADDLKDVQQSTETSGKTTARDEHLGRPNIALALGVTAATARLARLLDDGDRTLKQLLPLRPNLAFLRRLRNELHADLNRAMRQAGVIPIDRKR
jgi:geranylgeranyl diphosphate synthase, type II